MSEDLLTILFILSLGALAVVLTWLEDRFTNPFRGLWRWLRSRFKPSK